MLNGLAHKFRDAAVCMLPQEIVDGMQGSTGHRDRECVGEELGEVGLPPRSLRSSSMFPPIESWLVRDDEYLDRTVKECSEATANGGSEAADCSEFPTATSPKKPMMRVPILPDTARPVKGMRPQAAIGIRVSELLSGLSNVDGAWIFSGPLNDWPAYTDLVLLEIVARARIVGEVVEKKLWRTDSGLPLPATAEVPRLAWANFAPPAWTAVGWGPDSPGYVYWFTDAPDTRRILFGEAMCTTLREEERVEAGATATATDVHLFAHRYPVAQETLRDRRVWHMALLLEWSHRKYVTVVELAFLNGCGGYHGRSNFVEDKLADETGLYKTMPAAFKRPWDESLSEIRMYDVPNVTNREQFAAFLEKYSNRSNLPVKQQRFIDPTIYESKAVRLRSCTPSKLAALMLNYKRRVPEYTLMTTNCQTFAADAFAFLAGCEGVQPYGDVVKPFYQQRSKAFLYQPDYG